MYSRMALWDQEEQGTQTHSISSSLAASQSCGRSSVSFREACSWSEDTCSTSGWHWQLISLKTSTWYYHCWCTWITHIRWSTRHIRAPVLKLNLVKSRPLFDSLTRRSNRVFKPIRNSWAKSSILTTCAICSLYSRRSALTLSTASMLKPIKSTLRKSTSSKSASKSQQFVRNSTCQFGIRFTPITRSHATATSRLFLAMPSIEQLSERHCRLIISRISKPTRFLCKSSRQPPRKLALDSTEKA